MDKGLLIVISGPSGVGKGTICKELLKDFNDIEVSVSATTREPREGEIDGVNYYYKTKEEFKDMIDRDNFLEYAQVHGNYYGTPKKNVLEKLELGKNILLEIDIQGALKVKDEYPHGVFIFVVPPSMEELKNRIIGRGTETEDSIETRFNNAYEEMKFINKYDYGIINDKLELAVEKIKCIITAEKCKVSRENYNI
ncbi:guanylate kinase [Dethiothermospora halolimnae]|uniref:guanylate kinase n=1 Tax=Dethiothermospora halolimnae TaxID=3114390 RepID=UPI003CCC18E8